MNKSYSELFFNKSIYEIKEKDVISFFKDEQEESSILEFKSGQVTLEKIYKEVAALHNSQGGLLIIGSPIPKKDQNGKETFKGKITNSNFKNKDWLYQKLYSNISPAPIDIQIHDIPCRTGIIQILDIPKSVNPPHQVLANGVYYIRYETETKFAPHGLVEALFNKRKQAKAQFGYHFIAKNENINRKMIYYFTSDINNIVDVPITNIGYIMNFYNVLRVEKDNTEIEKNKIDSNDVIYSFIDRNSNAISFTLVKGISIPFEYFINHFSEPFIISISVWGDNMNLQQFNLMISPLDNKFRVIEDNDIGLFKNVEIAIQDILTKNKEDLDIKGFKSLLNKTQEFLNQKVTK